MQVLMGLTEWHVAHIPYGMKPSSLICSFAHFKLCRRCLVLTSISIPVSRLTPYKARPTSLVPPRPQREHRQSLSPPVDPSVAPTIARSSRYTQRVHQACQVVRHFSAVPGHDQLTLTQLCRENRGGYHIRSRYQVTR